MSTFNCLVSTSRTRRPLTVRVTADDDAHAAVEAAIEMGFPGDCRPWVHPRPGVVWHVTNGHVLFIVSILKEVA